MHQFLPQQSNSLDQLRDSRSIVHARWKFAVTLIGRRGVFAPDHPARFATLRQIRNADQDQLQPEFRDFHPECPQAERSFPRSVQAVQTARVFPEALSAQEPPRGSSRPPAGAVKGPVKTSPRTTPPL